MSEETPRILFSKTNERYRVVLVGTRIILEWRDTDAAGSVRWLHVDWWDKTNTHAQSSHADIAMECILSNLDSLMYELKIQDGEPL